MYLVTLVAECWSVGRVQNMDFCDMSFAHVCMKLT
jgi:hypothetical protein